MKGMARMGTIAVFALVTVIIAVIGTYIAGQIAKNKLAQRFPPTGIIIDSGAHQIHVKCNGDGPVTIILEAGLNDFSIHWNRVVPLLSKDTRTCAYDRAGLGWSTSHAVSAKLQDAVANLQTVVSTVSNNKPLVLVGHSYGSLIVRLFAQLHPERIRAIILLDPANEHMPERIKGYSEVLTAVASQFNTLSRLADFGLVALMPNKIPTGVLSGEALDQYRAVVASSHYLNAAAAESQAMVPNLRYMQTQDQSNLINIPITIISRGLADPIPGLPNESANSLENTWSELQQDLVNRLHAKQIVATTSSHSIHLMQPELVYETIKPYIQFKQ